MNARLFFRLIPIFGLLLLLASPAEAQPAAPAGGPTLFGTQGPLQPDGALAPDAGTTERISLASDGTQANDSSDYPSISADGRYVAFFSYAPNLVSGDANGFEDVFVHDRLFGTTTLISVASDEAQGNGSSSYPSISADGRYVAFVSLASNLVSGDTNGWSDVFVRDRLSGTTTLVSLASDEAQGDDFSYYPSISGDGRYVAFTSGASNLVSGDTNGWPDVFVRDRLNGTTALVSAAGAGTPGNGYSYAPSISADGCYVAFTSDASNLVSGDANGRTDVFVRDCLFGTTTPVSIASDEAQGNGGSYYPSISGDGRYVAFESEASNLVSGDTNGAPDVFVRDRTDATTTLVSPASDEAPGNGYSSEPSISADGRYMAFMSGASNLVSGDTNGVGDVFGRDRLFGTTTLVSQASDGTPGNSGSYYPSISGDGRYVAFLSSASNLVSGDTNGALDVFVRDRLTPAHPGRFIRLPLVLVGPR